MAPIIKIPPPRTLKRFGLTAIEYVELYGDGTCPICLKPYGVGARTPVIDHDHRTFEVRGIICSADNYWLGVMNDNAEKLQRASSYLTVPPTYGWAVVPRLADAPPVMESD